MSENLKTKKTKGKKQKIKTAIDLELQALKDRRKKISMACRQRYQTLESDFNAFYERNPTLKPKTAPKPTQSPRAAVPCTADRFASCEAVVYDYASGNRKIVQWDKMPKPVKPPKPPKPPKTPKGVADGCGCYF